MKKIIEDVLPLKTLSQSAMSDKAHKGHPGNMHLWWNRSPIDSSAAILQADLLDVPEEGNVAERQRITDELTQIADGKNTSIVEKNKGKYPVVCDPFSGFGGLAIAAQKIGMNVIAEDLNSVACLLTKAATEIPALFSNNTAVNPIAENKLYFEAEGLASDVEYYGGILKDIVKQDLKTIYPCISIPNSKDTTSPFAWIWVRTVKCPNPACGCRIPLASSYVLSKTNSHEYWAEPEITGKEVRFRIHKGVCPDDKKKNKYESKGAKFQCPACGATTKDEYIKKAGIEGDMDIQLMAVCMETSDGKIFIEADEDQINSANTSVPEELPIGTIPHNTKWFSPPGFGKTEYIDLFTPRQLKLLTDLCDSLPEIIEQVTTDALAAGMSDDQTPLSDGGKGAMAYGQAVGVYITLVIGKLANFQSSICTWDERHGNIRAAFTRQAIPMTWVFAEGNPFSAATGNYGTMLQNVVQSIKELKTYGEVEVKQGNAINFEFPNDSILFTEPPYYDNVGYADLSDYFYIWFRRCLKTIYPQLFEKVVTSKEELSSIPEHYGGDIAAATQAYQNGLHQLFQNFYKACNEQYPSVIFFEYSQKDNEAICFNNNIDGSTPFEHIICSMVQEGFSVNAVWPVRTDSIDSKHDAVRIAIVFKKKPDNIASISRRNFINTLKRELPRMLAISFAQDMEEEDKPIVGIGRGLSIFTQYEKVLNADGSDMCIRDALRLIYQEVIDYINLSTEIAQTEEA